MVLYCELLYSVTRLVANWSRPVCDQFCYASAWFKLQNWSETGRDFFERFNKLVNCCPHVCACVFTIAHDTYVQHVYAAAAGK